MKKSVDVREYLGEWGKYQTRLFLLLALPMIVKGMQAMMGVIAFHVPHHRCRIPDWQNDTYQVQDEAQQIILNLTIPKDEHEKQEYSKCTIFIRWNDSQPTNGTDQSDVEPCQSWVYDKTEMDSSLVTEFDLVCERKAYRAHLNMIFLVGNLIGSPVSGYLCDWFGRKTLFYITNTMCLILGAASAFPPSAHVFLVYRLILGILGSCVYTSVYVLTVELVGPTMHTRAGSLVTILWTMGPILVGILSYPVRDWQHIQLFASLPLVLTLGYWWLLPESPRWLLLKNKHKAALKVLRKAALANKLTPPPSIPAVKEVEEESDTKTREILSTIRQLVRYPWLVVRVFIIFFNWFAVSTTFYGLSLNVGSLGGSVRVNYLLSSGVEIVGYFIAWVLLERLGRKRSHCCFMLVAGLACLGSALTVSLGGQELQWATIALAMVGKMGVSASFTAVYLISSEIFPTVIRNIGLNCSATCGLIGSSLSPYLADLALYISGPFSRAVPLLAFGGLALLAGLLALLLPETLHRPLPDTLEDTVNFARNAQDKGAKETPGDQLTEGAEREQDTFL